MKSNSKKAKKNQEIKIDIPSIPNMENYLHWLENEQDFFTDIDFCERPDAWKRGELSAIERAMEVVKVAIDDYNDYYRLVTGERGHRVYNYRGSLLRR